MYFCDWDLLESVKSGVTAFLKGAVERLKLPALGST